MTFKQSEFLRRHILGLSLKLAKFMSFKPKWILRKTFVDSYFRVMWVGEFHTKGNSSENICWVSVWNYVTLSLSNKSEFIWRHLLTLNLKLCKFMTFKQRRILINAFVESQLEVIWLYEFQTNADSYEDISWASVGSCVSRWASNKANSYGDIF